MLRLCWGFGHIWNGGIKAYQLAEKLLIQCWEEEKNSNPTSQRKLNLEDFKDNKCDLKFRALEREFLSQKSLIPMGILEIGVFEQKKEFINKKSFI